VIQAMGRGKPAPPMLGALFFQMPSVCRTLSAARFMRTLHFGIGLEWKLQFHLITEYLCSIDHRRREPRHSLKARYTFNLGITGEK
jgi:hypothetical protein